MRQPFLEGYPKSTIIVATAGVLGVCGVSLMLLMVPLARRIFLGRYGNGKEDGEAGE